jgi:hypothetical protein
MTEKEPTYTLSVKESELTLLVSSLAYFEKRQLFLANMESRQGRDKQALARRETAAATFKLSERLYAIGANGGSR